MNYEKNGDLRCGKSAVKTVKGFTVIELLIVIAIIAILAGMTSLAIMGFVRNSNIESANSRAQLAYTSVQNMMIDIEIEGTEKYLDGHYIWHGTELSPRPTWATLEYYMLNGTLDESTLKLESSSPTSNTDITYSHFNTHDRTKAAVKFIKKSLEDSIDSSFTGYVFATIDLTDYVVESIVYSEDKEFCKNAVKGTNSYVDIHKNPTTSKSVYGISNVNAQKDDQKMTGEYLGFYPFMDDVAYPIVTKKSPAPTS